MQAQRLLLGSALQRADHAADALSSDGADAGVAPTSTNGRSSPRVVVALATVRPIVELTPRQPLRLAETALCHRVNCEPRGDGHRGRSCATCVFWIDEARVVRRRAEHIV
jgi:hypothetical protein